jgi:hypothetical protein
LILALAIAAPCIRAQIPTLAPPPPPGASSSNQKSDQGQHIRVSTDLMVLHATLTEDHRQFVHDLKPKNEVFVLNFNDEY